MTYSQNDPAWKNNKIGFDTGPGETLGNYGCYVTAIANVCAWAGNDLNPVQVNQICKERGWYSQGDLINNNEIPAILCSNLSFASATHWVGPTDMGFFADASDNSVAYIICIDASVAPGVQTHFTMVHAKSGVDDLIIDDSWDGTRKKLSLYGRPSAIIQSAYKFIKKGASMPDTEDKAIRELIVSMYWRALGFAPAELDLEHYIGVYRKKGAAEVWTIIANSPDGIADWKRRNPERVAKLEAELASKTSVTDSEAIAQIQKIKEILKVP